MLPGPQLAAGLPVGVERVASGVVAVVVEAGLEQLPDVLGSGLRPDRYPPAPATLRRHRSALPGWCGSPAPPRSTGARTIPGPPGCAGGSGQQRLRGGEQAVISGRGDASARDQSRSICVSSSHRRPAARPGTPESADARLRSCRRAAGRPRESASPEDCVGTLSTRHCGSPRAVAVSRPPPWAE